MPKDTKINTLLTKVLIVLAAESLWQKIPAGMLEREVMNVLPAFWKHYKKTIPNKKFVKSHLLKPAKDNDTWKTNLGKFLLLVGQISDGKAPNTISTKRRAKELEKDAKKCDLLAEFIKADESEWLAISEEGKEDELDKVRSIFESNGAEISSLKRWEVKRKEMAAVTVHFRLMRAHNDDGNDHHVNYDEL